MSGDDRHIFHDPTGKRRRRFTLAAGVALSLVAAVVAGFLATLAFAPRLPSGKRSSVRAGRWRPSILP